MHILKCALYIGVPQKRDFLFYSEKLEKIEKLRKCFYICTTYSTVCKHPWRKVAFFRSVVSANAYTPPSGGHKCRKLHFRHLAELASSLADYDPDRSESKMSNVFT